jgi:hypothetical protein
VLNGRPLIGREGFNGPAAIEPANSRILLATEWTVGQIDYHLIIHVRHTDLHPSGKASASSEIARKNCTGEAVLRSVGELESVILVARANDRSNGAEDFLARQLHVVRHVGENMRRQYAARRLASSQFARAGAAGVLGA